MYAASLASIAILLGVRSCAYLCNSSQTQMDLGPTRGVTLEQATELARQALYDRDWNPDDYNMTTDEHQGEWVLSFEHKPPSPPGAEITFYVSKRDGSVRAMQGE